MIQGALDFEGKKRKRAGQKLVRSHNEVWMGEALKWLSDYGRVNREFTIELFRMHCEVTGKPKPTHNNAYGALATQAQRAELIIWTRRYANAVSPKTHSHPVKIYHSLTYRPTESPSASETASCSPATKSPELSP